MTNLKDVKSDRVREELNTHVKAGFICFITGPSGSGKDFIAAKAMKNKDAWCFLDQFGESSTGKWIVSLPASAAKAKVFVGQSDNFRDVVDVALTLTKAAKAALFVVKPDYPLWVAINRMKAVDYKGDHEEWRKGWLAKSKQTPREYEKYFAKKLTSFISNFQRAGGDIQREVFVVENTLEGVVRNGWHVNKADAKDAAEDAKDSATSATAISEPLKA
jgi:hypothetical protein